MSEPDLTVPPLLDPRAFSKLSDGRKRIDPHSMQRICPKHALVVRKLAHLSFVWSSDMECFSEVLTRPLTSLGRSISLTLQNGDDFIETVRKALKAEKPQLSRG